MRTFTLVIGAFNLEVEQYVFTNYQDAKCQKVGFSVKNCSSIESILFPFCEYLVKKRVNYSARHPSKLIYRDFTLGLEYNHPNIYIGICKEIEFEDHHHLDNLIDTFLNKVDEYLEKTMRTQFTVVYEGFTLEVWETRVINTPLWNGKCEAIRYEGFEFVYLDTLVGFFRGEVDEYLKPTEIEYRGHKLEVSLSKEIENKFEGYSDICDGWTTLQSTKEEVINAFKVRVDATIRLNIQSLESAVTKKQDELESYLHKVGYVFDVPVSNSLSLYAIHPDYYKQWKASSKVEFPENTVVFVRER